MRHDIYFNIKEYEVFSTTIGVTVYIMYSALFINKFIKSAKVEFPLPPTKIQGIAVHMMFSNFNIKSINRKYSMIDNFTAYYL